MWRDAEADRWGRARVHPERCHQLPDTFQKLSRGRLQNHPGESESRIGLTFAGAVHVQLIHDTGTRARCRRGSPRRNLPWHTAGASARRPSPSSENRLQAFNSCHMCRNSFSNLSNSLNKDGVSSESVWKKIPAVWKICKKGNLLKQLQKKGSFSSLFLVFLPHACPSHGRPVNYNKYIYSHGKNY